MSHRKFRPGGGFSEAIGVAVERVNPSSVKPIFGRKKKEKMFFRKFYSYFSFYAGEKNFGWLHFTVHQLHNNLTPPLW